MPFHLEQVPPSDPVWGDPAHHEVVCPTLEAYVAAALALTGRASQTWIWRGQARAEWPLQSLLHRTFPADAEQALVRREESCLAEAREDWLLGRTDGGAPRSAIELLALLQHHGSPSRLIDFSRSALIGLWFAVTPGFGSWHSADAREVDMASDGRVFAVDIEDAGQRKRRYPREMSKPLARSDSLPWVAMPAEFEVARTWTPESLFPRVDRQLGCFAVSRTPVAPKRHRTSIDLNTNLSQPQLERLVGVGPASRGRHPGDRLVLFRIPAASKPTIAWQLEVTFGLHAAHLYPDPEGFAATASWLPAV